jgi:hypothetical protein
MRVSYNHWVKKHTKKADRKRVVVPKMATSVNESEFFDDVVENGYHIFSLNLAKKPGFYPNKFPDYPGIKLSSLVVGDHVTIRAFFRIGSGEPIQVDGGYIDLEVELVEEDHIFGVIITKLPAHFPLQTGSSLEIMEDEILYKVEPTVH